MPIAMCIYADEQVAKVYFCEAHLGRLSRPSAKRFHTSRLLAKPLESFGHRPAMLPKIEEGGT
jgi:hypothetical protein